MTDASPQPRAPAEEHQDSPGSVHRVRAGRAGAERHKLSGLEPPTRMRRARLVDARPLDKRAVEEALR